MTDASREELLSAYLDDELSPDRRAQVEQWLLDSAELRQVFADLRNVRKDVQSLPRHKLPEDLGPVVLRRAEQAVLSGKESPTAGGSVRLSSAIGQWWSRSGSKRMLIWPALAVAAALVVALFDVGSDKREVAKRVEREDDAGRAAGETPSGATVSPAEYAAAGEEGGAAEALSSVRSSKAGRSATPPPNPPPEQTAESKPADASHDLFSKLRSSSLSDNSPAAMPPKAGLEFGAVGQQAEQRFVQALKMETDVRRALANRERVNFIQCDVSPEFISGNEMQKVLNTNGAKFALIAEPASGRKKNQSAAQAGMYRDLAEQRFAVEATPAQVEKIVTELDEERSRKRVSNLILGLQEQPADVALNAAEAPAQQMAKEDESLKSLKRRQTLTIYLRKMDEAPPAAPAEAAPAKK